MSIVHIVKELEKLRNKNKNYNQQIQPELVDVKINKETKKEEETVIEFEI